MNTNCEQVLNYCCSSSRGKNTIRNSTLNTISSVVLNHKFIKKLVNMKKYCIFNGLAKLKKWTKKWTLSFRGYFRDYFRDYFFLETLCMKFGC
jgi:hypothetical protein